MSASFSRSFDCAVQLCAEAQQVVRTKSSMFSEGSAVRARYIANRQRRALAREARENLAAASALFETLRQEVEGATDRLKDHGVAEMEIVSLMTSRVRLVLYDRAFGELDVEPLVDRVSSWTHQRCRAA